MTTDFPTFRLFSPRFAALPSADAADLLAGYATENRSYGVTALAVHGLMESVLQAPLGEKINNIDMVLPDGQPIVWALRLFHQVPLQQKVPGPDLTLDVLKRASDQGLGVFLYGSTQDTLEKFSAFIELNYPGVVLCGVHEDRFRDASSKEDLADIHRINASGAHIVLVGRGCPRQEHWVADHVGKVNAVMLAVGAAFDYHAGKLQRAPRWMQISGLEWAYRLMQEPGRLWKRYLVSNSWFLYSVLKHKLLVKAP